LVNTKTVLAALATSTTRPNCDKPKCPAHAKRSMCGGKAVSIKMRRGARTAIK
jgi:hypothetical protein